MGELITHIHAAYQYYSIKTKLVLLINILVLLLILFINIFVPRKMETEIYSLLNNKLKEVSSVTVYSLSSALLFDDIADVYQILESLSFDDQIQYLAVYDTTGNRLVNFNEQQTENYMLKSGFKKTPIFSSDGKLLIHVTPIKFEGNKLGYFQIGYSLDKTIHEVKKIRNTIYLMSVFVFILSFIGTWIIGGVILNPVKSLTKDIKSRKTDDFTFRLKVRRLDEVGILTDSFNKLMSNVNAAQSELNAINKELDKRVEEKTEELNSALIRVEKEKDGLQTVFEAAMNQEEEIIRLQTIIDELGGDYE